MEPLTHLIWGEPGSRIAKISDEQGGVAIKVEIPISAHVVFPLSLGMGRETLCEFMCLQTWKKFMEPQTRLVWYEQGCPVSQILVHQ